MLNGISIFSNKEKTLDVQFRKTWDPEGNHGREDGALNISEK
jgi:hypothetical protein